MRCSRSANENESPRRLIWHFPLRETLFLVPLLEKGANSRQGWRVCINGILNHSEIAISRIENIEGIGKRRVAHVLI